MSTLGGRKKHSPCLWRMELHAFRLVPSQSLPKNDKPLVHFAWMLGLELFANSWISIKPLKVKLLAGEQKASEKLKEFALFVSEANI